MFQKILLWSYVFLGIGAFCYWVSAVLSFFRMLKHRRKDRSMLSVVTGLFRDTTFTAEGNAQRRNFLGASTRLFLAIAAMYIVVLIGIQTQG